MKFYTFPASPGCRPIAMFIADHGMTVEEQTVDLMKGEQNQPWFLALNPNHAVPVLQDGDFVLTESSAILKYLADVVDSPAYPKPLQARARVNATMDWINTGLYRSFGYSLCYPQVLPNVRLPDETANNLLVSAGQAGSREWLKIMNDHMLGGRNPWLCGETLTIADYLASGIVSMGELIGCDFSPWPHVHRWYQRIQALPNWRSSNAGLYQWAQYTKGPEYVRV
jgi:glutathione S-transferase